MSKKKTLTFKIKIPMWLYRYRWDNIKKYAAWLWKPNRCEICGTKTVFKNPNIDWYDGNSRRMMLHYNVEGRGNYSKCVCRKCAAKTVSYENAVSKYDSGEFHDFETREMCDCCKQPVLSYKWVAFKMPNGEKLGFITGREWWNGFYFCPDCIKQTVENGKESSSIHGGHYDKEGKWISVPTNNFGLPVVDGKVKFPW